MDEIRAVAMDEIELSNRNFMQGFLSIVRAHMGKQNSNLIVRMHPDAFNTHFPIMTGSIKSMSNAAQENVRYVCNLNHDKDLVTFSFAPLDSDMSRCRLPSEL